jgi:acetylxylan esterase
MVVGALLVLVISAGAVFSDSSSASRQASAGYCVIDSRGSGEPLGTLSPPGAAFVRVLRQLVAPAEVAVVTNPYPARGGWPHLIEAGLKLPTGYHPSVVEGKGWLSAAIANPPAGCHSGKLILTGYSQGAQVTADVFENGSIRDVLAVVLFGDPYFNGSDSHADRTNSQVPFTKDRHGALGRRPLFAPSSYGHVFSFCHGGDPVCQVASNPLAWTTWHNNYDKLSEPADAAGRIVALISNGRVKGASLLWNGGSFVVRPASITMSPTGQSLFAGPPSGGVHGRIDWKSWTTEEAQGAGAEWNDDCIPDCPTGTFRANGSLTLRAFAPVGGRFTRLEVRKSGGQRVVLRLQLQTGTYYEWR